MFRRIALTLLLAPVLVVVVFTVATVTALAVSLYVSAVVWSELTN